MTPFGEIVALAGRGTFTGNRGVLHDDARRVVRPWQVRRWITCRLEYKGIRRTVMTPHTWTELFFLDEATAFSAGHRPCGECRRDDYRRFRTLWERHFGAPAGADAMDDVIHAHRIARREKITYREAFETLPDGAFVVCDGRAELVLGPWLLEWSDAGYVRRRERPRDGDAEVLTPKPLVAIVKAGYEPAIHASAYALG